MNLIHSRRFLVKIIISDEENRMKKYNREYSWKGKQMYKKDKKIWMCAK